MRALAVTSAQRAAVTPELPTMVEAGLPGYEFTSWYGIIAPAATPRAVVMRLNETINRILNQADMPPPVPAAKLLMPDAVEHASVAAPSSRSAERFITTPAAMAAPTGPTSAVL